MIYGLYIEYALYRLYVCVFLYVLYKIKILYMLFTLFRNNILYIVYRLYILYVLYRKSAKALKIAKKTVNYTFRETFCRTRRFEIYFKVQATW